MAGEDHLTSHKAEVSRKHWLPKEICQSSLAYVQFAFLKVCTDKIQRLGVPCDMLETYYLYAVISVMSLRNKVEHKKK